MYIRPETDRLAAERESVMRSLGRVVVLPSSSHGRRVCTVQDVVQDRRGARVALGCTGRAPNPTKVVVHGIDRILQPHARHLIVPDQLLVPTLVGQKNAAAAFRSLRYDKGPGSRHLFVGVLLVLSTVSIVSAPKMLCVRSLLSFGLLISAHTFTFARVSESLPTRPVATFREIISRATSRLSLHRLGLIHTVIREEPGVNSI